MTLSSAVLSSTEMSLVLRPSFLPEIETGLRAVVLLPTGPACFALGAPGCESHRSVFLLEQLVPPRGAKSPWQRLRP